MWRLPRKAIECKRTPNIWSVTTLIVLPTVTNMIKVIKDAILVTRPALMEYFAMRFKAASVLPNND